ncbi:MAG: DUF4255 domain-containing protein [Sulfitobacter sp.]
MTTLNLSHVTVTLQNLLSRNVRRLLGGTAVNDPAVTLMPPELVTATNRTLNLHLYHVAEDPHYRNMAGIPGGTPAISTQPMALRLFYVLTAHLTRVNEFDAVTQQELLGLAMKTFHDNPVIKDDLVILPTPASPPTPVMHAELLGDGNKIEIVPRNLDPEDNLNFWAAEDQKTPRASAYYEVRTVFLSPEDVRNAQGTVFDLGLYVESSAAARLRGSRSILGFTMPTETGLGAQAFDVTPARATIRAVAVPDKPAIRLTGTNLTAGDVQLLYVVQGGQSYLMDPTINPAWEMEFTTGEISFVVQPMLDVDDGAGGVNSIPITPGKKGFDLTIRSYRIQGSTRLNADYNAGRVDVALGAHIDGHAGPAGGLFTLDVDAIVDLTLADDVRLAVGGEYYTRETVAAPTGPGTFVVTAAQITFQPHQPLPFSGTHPVQIFVDGGESQPYWIEVP